MRINIYLILQIVICLQMAIGAENTIPERKLIRLRGSHNHRSEGTIKQDDNTVVLQPHENEKEQDEHLDEVEEREEEGKEDECEHENESECEFYKRASQSPSYPHHKRQREEEPQHPDLPTPKKESPIHPPSMSHTKLPLMALKAEVVVIKYLWVEINPGRHKKLLRMRERSCRINLELKRTLQER